MLELSYLDTCLPCYFRGYHMPVVQVMVFNDTTYKDIKESLLDYQTYDHLFEDDRLPNFDFDAYVKAVNSIFENIDMDDVCSECQYIDISSTDDIDDDSYCYMFFGVNIVD